MVVSASRVVAFVVTPLLTAGATVGTAWLAKHFPGLPQFDPAQITAEALTVGGLVGAACLKWLHGLSLFERTIVPAVTTVEKVVNTFAPGVLPAGEVAVEKAAEAEVKKVVAIVPPAPAEAWPPAPPAEPAPAPAPATPAA
jgi:hypothetical protein